jgi:hypothetical protein
MYHHNYRRSRDSIKNDRKYDNPSGNMTNSGSIAGSGREADGLPMRNTTYRPSSSAALKTFHYGQTLIITIWIYLRAIKFE